MAKEDPTRRIVADNRKARYNYFIEDKLEAGVVLTGTEVKSLREGRASIGEAYAGEQEGALVLFNAHIPEYKAANRFNHPPKQPRRLLVHKRELERLMGAIRRDGMTLVPLSIYFNPRGIAKVDLGLAKGKKQVDKRQTTKDREWQRSKARLMRSRG